jgi:hypothetical protein
MTRFLSLKKEYVSYALVLLCGLLLSAMAAKASTTISTNIATGGNITVAAAYGLDTSAGGALNIGTTTATSITIGSTGMTTTFPGSVAVTQNVTVTGATNTATASSTGLVKVDSLTVGTGSTASHLLLGSCSLIVPSGAGATVTASSTAAFDCAVSGVTSTDNVIAQIATSTAASGTIGGTGSKAGLFSVVGAKASTTSGFITVVLLNMSGANTQPSLYGFGSTTAYWIFR